MQLFGKYRRVNTCGIDHKMTDSEETIPWKYAFIKDLIC